MANEVRELNIISLPDICQTFPEPIFPQISRDVYLTSIDALFSNGTQIVLLHAEEGMGKTTLLSQFARLYGNKTLSIFISTATQYGSSYELMRYDLCNQIQWLLNSTTLDANIVNDGLLNSLKLELQRKSRTTNETFYFIVDGVDDIDNRDGQNLSSILNMLPIGFPRCRILFSSKSDKLPHELSNKLLTERIRLLKFDLQEAKDYLKDMVTDENQIRDLYNTCRGIPGYLSSIRRILKNEKIDVLSLIDNMPDRLPALFDIEWRKLGVINEDTTLLLAMIALDDRIHTIDTLAQSMSLDTQTIYDILRTIPFILIANANSVTYVSEPFRRYAASNLSYLKQTINELVIESLLLDQDSDNAINDLPDFLQQAGRHGELLAFLTPDKFQMMLERTQSFQFIRQKTQSGLAAALQLNKYGELLRFGLQGSAIAEISDAKPSRIEIEARLAVDDYSGALKLAQNAVVKDERLLLLTIVAKNKVAQGLSPDPALNEQIKQLYEQLNSISLGKRTIEIASELVHVFPDLAISLIENAVHTDMPENATDWALAAISLSALNASDKQDQPIDIAESIRLRIKDPFALKFSSEMSVLVKRYNAIEIIAKSDDFDTVSSKVLMLGQWAVNNRKQKDAYTVIEHALSLMIRSNGYRPNAGVYRRLASPLPYVEDVEVLRHLIGRLDNQRDSAEHNGPTQEYVWFQLILAEAENKIDHPSMCLRLMDVFLYICEINDPPVRSECLVRLYKCLRSVDADKKLEDRDKLHSQTETLLNSTVHDILTKTAQHSKAIKEVIEVLASIDLTMSITLALKLNTCDRRDSAILAALTRYARISHKKLNCSALIDGISKFSDPFLRDKAILKILQSLESDKSHLEDRLRVLMPIVNMIDSMQDSEDRCEAACIVYSLIASLKQENLSGIGEHLLKVIDIGWESLDTEWKKIDLGFNITKNLAEWSLDVAKEYLKRTEIFRDQVTLGSQLSASTFIAALRLSSRAYRGLVWARLNRDEDFSRLAMLIDIVSSRGERCAIWADCALLCKTVQGHDQFRNIIERKLKPLLDNLSKDDFVYYSSVLISICPALYIYHRGTCLKYLECVPQTYRDGAYWQIADYILKRTPHTDPYETVSEQVFNITYEDVLDILELIGLMNTDCYIYYFIEKLTNCITSVKLKQSLTQNQKGDIISRLTEIIDQKLPSNNYIQHDGYKIIAKAQLYRMKSISTRTWDDLITEARAVPNLADKVFVLAYVATTIGKKDSRSTLLLNEAKTLIKDIPVPLDRIDRYEDVALKAREIAPNIAKECLELGMTTAVKADTPSVYDSQRRLIDLAYRIDRDLANSIASLTDEDPARSGGHSVVAERLRTLDCRQKMIEQDNEESSNVNAAETCPQAAWMLLGSLNADRLQPVHFDQARDFIGVASRLPMHKSYAILSWVIENTNKRFHSTSQAESYIRPIFEATLIGAEVTQRLSVQSARERSSNQTLINYFISGNSRIIKAGERPAALEYLQDWLQRVAHDYVKVVDPYFSPDDLELIWLIQSVNPELMVTVLSSKINPTTKLPQSAEDFRSKWSSLYDQSPPDTELLLIGMPIGSSFPIHDRWWISNGGGLRIGTSFNGLGKKRDSEISILSAEEALSIERIEILPYSTRSKKEHDGHRFTIDLITL